MNWLPRHFRTPSRWTIVSVLVFLTASTLVFTYGHAALAQFSSTDASSAAGQFGISTANVDLRELIIRIVKYLLSFLGLVAILIMMYGGFVWMTSRGDASRVELAKKIIINGLIGLVIIVLAYVIVNVLVSSLNKAINPPVAACTVAGEVCAGGCGTCGGSPLACVVDPLCVPGGPGSNQFRVRINPTDGATAVAMNAPVKFRFNKFPDPSKLPGGNAASGGVASSATDLIIVRPDDGAGNPDMTKQVDGQFTRTVYSADPPTNPPTQPQTVTFIPDSLCADGATHCFEKNKKYHVRVEDGASGVVVISTNETLTCGGSTPCETTFTTSDKVDLAGPNISFVKPDSNQVPNAAGVKFIAQADDGSGINELKLTPLDENDANIVATQVFSGAGATSFIGTLSPDLDFSAVAVGTARKFKVEATDDIGNLSTEIKSTIVRPLHCTNNVQDAGEVGLDCGIAADCSACPGEACNATPNQTPAVCTANNLACASNACSATTCTCLAAPIIKSVNPLDGAPGNFITIKGSGFGAIQGSGKVKFLGPSNLAADDIEAVLPPVCSAAINWTDTQIIVVVPDPSPATHTTASPWTGPIEVIADSTLADTTNNSNGPHINDFQINETVRPGLCQIDPSHACVDATVTFKGSRFGASQGNGDVKYGNVDGIVNSWAGSQIVTKVPNLRVSTFGAYVQDNAGEKSNALDFSVESCKPKPRIDSLTPENGPNGQTVTIFGANFGTQKGVVYFNDAGNLVPADVNFPAECSASGFWQDNQIVVKVPEADKLPIAVGATRAIPVYVQRPDNEQSNSDKIFTLNTNPATPALYCLVPDNGPIDKVKVDFIGDQFGVGAPGNAVKFSAASGQIDASLTGTTWSKQKVSQVLVPTGTKTGATNVVLAGKVCEGNRSKACSGDSDCGASEGKCVINASNPVNFTAGTCTADAQCNVGGSTSRQCCVTEGICRPTGSCPASTVVPDGSYRWRFTVGEAKIAPAVVEQAGCGVASEDTGHFVVVPFTGLMAGNLLIQYISHPSMANQPVILSFWAKKPSSSAATNLSVYVADSALTPSTWETLVSAATFSPALSTSWQEYRFEVTTPSSTVDDFAIIFGEMGVGSGTIDLDNISLIHPDGTELIQNGDVEGAAGNWKKIDGTDAAVQTGGVVANQGISGTQSPSPFKGSTNACTNALISVRFTTLLKSPVLPAAMEVKKCTDADPKNPCKTLQSVSPIDGNQPTIFSVDATHDGLGWQPLAAWEPNTTYQVKIKKEGIKSDKDIQMLKDYQWTFKTSTTCAIKTLSCKPVSSRLVEDDPGTPADESTARLTADRLAGNCNILACVGAGTVSWASSLVNAVNVTGLGSCQAIASSGADEGTANVTAQSEGKSAVCKVENAFKSLAVSEAYPRCSAVCLNASIGALFTTQVDPATITKDNLAASPPDLSGTVKLFVCAPLTTKVCSGDGKPCANAGNCAAASPAQTCDFALDTACKTNGAEVALSGVSYTDVGSNNKPQLTITPAVSLVSKTNYRVILTNGILSTKNKPLGGLNYDVSGIKGYSWVFGTSDKECKVAKVITSPGEAVVKTIGATAEFSAEPWSSADACSPSGQRLNPSLSDYGWSAVKPLIGQFDGGTPNSRTVTPFKTCGGGSTDKWCTGGVASSDCALEPVGKKNCAVFSPTPAPVIVNPTQKVVAVGSDNECQIGAGSGASLINKCSTDISTITPDEQKRLMPGVGATLTATPPAKFTLQCGFAPAGSCLPQDTIATGGVDGVCSNETAKTCRSVGDCSNGGKCLGQGDANCDGQVNLTDLDALNAVVDGTSISSDMCAGLDVKQPPDGTKNADDTTRLKEILQSKLGRCTAGKVGQQCKVDTDCTNGTVAGVCSPPTRVCSNDRSINCEASLPPAWGSASQNACNSVKTGNQCGGGTPEGTCGTVTVGKCDNDNSLSCTDNKDCNLAVNTAGCCGVRPFPESVEYAYSPLYSTAKVCPNTVIKVKFSTLMNSASVIKATRLMRNSTTGNCNFVAINSSLPWWEQAWQYLVKIITGDALAAGTLCQVDATVTTRNVVEPIDATHSITKTVAVISPKELLRSDQEYQIWIDGAPASGGVGGATSAVGIQMATTGNFFAKLSAGDVAAEICAIVDVQVKIDPDLSAAQEALNPRLLTRPYDIFNCAGNNCTCTTSGGPGCRIINGGQEIGEDQDAIAGNQHRYTAIPVSAASGELNASGFTWEIIGPTGLLTPNSALSGDASTAKSLLLSDAPDRNGIGNVKVTVSAGAGAQTISKSKTFPVSIFLCQNPWTGGGPNGLVDSTNNFSTTYCKDGDLPEFAKTAEVPASGNAAGTILKDYILKDTTPSSPDAIGIRVVSNRWHSSPKEWYDLQRFPKGSPQSIVVDGYPAIRDGRTLYVGAGNLSGTSLYTNIYIISYNQGANPNTVKVFNQLIKNLTFNINALAPGQCLHNVDGSKLLEGSKKCTNAETKSCQSDGDCNVPTAAITVASGNGSFESDAAGYTFGSSGNVETGAAALGSKYFKFTKADEYIEFIAQEASPIMHGRRYRLSMAVKSGVSNAGGHVRAIFIGFQDSPFSELDTIDITNDWQRISGTMVVNSDYTGSGAVIKIATDTVGTQIDDIKVEYVGGACQGAARSCVTNTDCKSGYICDSTKASLARDVQRISDVLDTAGILEDYRYGTSCPKVSAGAPGDSDCSGTINAHDLTVARGYAAGLGEAYNPNICAGADVDNTGDVTTADVNAIEKIVTEQCGRPKSRTSNYPSLTAGSYLVGASTSAWPSWSQTLSTQLSTTLPIDPRNRFMAGACTGSGGNGYDANTCWDNANKKYQSTSIPNIPVGSHIYTYNGYTGNDYAVCAFMESCANPQPDAVGTQRSSKRFCAVSSNGVTLPSYSTGACSSSTTFVPPPSAADKVVLTVNLQGSTTAAETQGVVYVTPVAPSSSSNCLGSSTVGATTCTPSVFKENTIVMAASVTDADSARFDRWVWATAPAGCSPTNPVCVMTPTAATTVTAKFIELPPSITLSASASTVTSGQTVTLSWRGHSITAITSIVSTPGGTITAPSSGWPLSGNYTTPPLTATTKFEITAASGSGPVTSTVTVNVGEGQVNLTVNKSGSGDGTVVSSPSGIINCGSTCSNPVTIGATVSLTATPAAGSGLPSAGVWGNTCVSQGGSVSGSTCTIRVESPLTLTATFVAGAKTVTVAKVTGFGAGDGTVTVVSPSPKTPSPENPCTFTVGDGRCVYSFDPAATNITLKATAASGYNFDQWYGDCTSTTTTDVTNDTCIISSLAAGNKQVTASFQLPKVTLTVYKAGTGDGDLLFGGSHHTLNTVDPTWSQDMPKGFNPILYPSPAADSDFTGWTVNSGVPPSTLGTCPTSYTSGSSWCQVTMNGPVKLTANFKKKGTSLTVAIAGSGTVKHKKDAGVESTCTMTDASCGAVNYDYNDEVTLEAFNPSSGYTFKSWSGCVPVDPPDPKKCKVTMNASKTVTATFEAWPVLAVTVTGSGRVGSGDGKITTCRSGSGDCSEQYPVGAFTPSLVLTATAEGGSSAFASWTNCPSPSGNECTITNMPAGGLNITAHFAGTHTLTMNKSGTGAGGTPIGYRVNAGGVITECAVGSSGSAAQQAVTPVCVIPPIIDGVQVSVTAVAATGNALGNWWASVGGPAGNAAPGVYDYPSFTGDSTLSIEFSVPPTVLSGPFTTNEDTAVTFTPGNDADGDLMTYTITSSPAHGTLSSCTSTTCTYTPNADYNGNDSFTLEISDSMNVPPTSGTVNIIVNPVNDWPTAVAKCTSSDNPSRSTACSAQVGTTLRLYGDESYANPPDPGDSISPTTGYNWTCSPSASCASLGLTSSTSQNPGPFTLPASLPPINLIRTSIGDSGSPFVSQAFSISGGTYDTSTPNVSNTKGGQLLYTHPGDSAHNDLLLVFVTINANQVITGVKYNGSDLTQMRPGVNNDSIHGPSGYCYDGTLSSNRRVETWFKKDISTTQVSNKPIVVSIEGSVNTIQVAAMSFQNVKVSSLPATTGSGQTFVNSNMGCDASSANQNSLGISVPGGLPTNGMIIGTAGARMTANTAGDMFVATSANTDVRAQQNMNTLTGGSGNIISAIGTNQTTATANFTMSSGSQAPGWNVTAFSLEPIAGGNITVTYTLNVTDNGQGQPPGPLQSSQSPSTCGPTVTTSSCNIPITVHP